MDVVLENTCLECSNKVLFREKTKNIRDGNYIAASRSDLNSE